MSKNTKQENIECRNLEKKAKYTSVKMKKGITLIALVVTIVVLLILASVSIAAVFGDNGLLKLAKEAADKTNEAVKNDISSMGELEDILHETQTGIVVEKVTDAKPGKLEESGENTYTINSIEDLVAFAHNVTSGADNYEGKTVKLGLSLDFASTKSYVDAYRTDYGEYGYNGELKKILNESGFIPIGPSNWEINDGFCGIFDGNNNTIYNLRIIKEVLDSDVLIGVGMFTMNSGIIQDLNIKNANIYANIRTGAWSCIGILASTIPGGKIDRCHVSGKIVGTVENCDIGGIAGSTGNGKVLNSYSEVDMEILGNNESVYEGLIVGSCNEGGTIKNVYSKGAIYPSNYGKTGLSVGASNGNIENSYTLGKVNVNVDMARDIGIRSFGYGTGPGKVYNCYYLGSSINEVPKNGVTVWVDRFSTPGEAKTEEDMKKPEFINSLNEEQEGNPWKQDTNNINDGYPILSWQQ